MIINFSPVFADGSTVVFVAGDKITINDQEFDFTPLKPGFVLPQDAIDSIHFAGPVFRQASGELEVTLRLPHHPDAPEYMQFPDPIRVTKDGPVEVPTYVAPEPPDLSYVPELEQDDGLLEGPADTDPRDYIHPGVKETGETPPAGD